MEIVHQPLGSCWSDNCQEDIYGLSNYCLKCVKQNERCTFCGVVISKSLCFSCYKEFSEWLVLNFSISSELAKYYVSEQWKYGKYYYGPDRWPGFYAREKWVKFNLDQESFDGKEISEENCAERITNILESNRIYLERDIQCDISSLTKSARK